MPVNSPSILLVEDNATQGKVLRACVEQMGLPTLGPVTTAAEALRLCANVRPALALLDVQLTGTTDGVTLAGQLQMLGHIPIIYVSGTTDPVTLRRMALSGPVATLPKPYTLGDMRRAIERGVYGQERTLPNWPAPPTAALPEVSWLFVREHGLLVRVPKAAIVCVEMQEKYCVLTLTGGGRHTVRMPLAALLDYLVPAGFVQVHRSWLVALGHVVAVDLAAGTIRLPGGMEAPLGKAFRAPLVAQLRLMD